MATSVPAAKTGIRAYLASWSGLRPGDGVTVRSAPVAPDELAAKQVTLGDVVAPQEWAGLAGKAETPMMTCWARAEVAGSDETAMAAARDQVAALLAAAEAAVKADPSCAGAVRPPGQATVAGSTLSEGPGDGEGAATRWATYQFQITWTSHVG